MLGKLFNLSTGQGGGPAAAAQAPASSKHISSLESVQEDIHTRNLLFPDTQALYQHRHDQVFPLSNNSAQSASTANAFDYNGDVDLDTRDVRVIIMQDALGSTMSTASLLYDSQPTPPIVSSPTDRGPMSANPLSSGLQDTRRNPTSPRKSSLSQSSRPVVIQPDSPQLRQGAFDRRSSMQGRRESYVETEAQRAAREYREELATFSGCIFGNSELMAYKGTSTKVHVVPIETRHTDYAASSFVGDGRGSIGRSSARTSKLAHSFTSESGQHFGGPVPLTPGTAIPPPSDRRKVLITRLFPVNLPNDDEISDPSITPQSRYSEDGTGFPFPIATDDGKTKKRKPQMKQKRTPMYAVALVINLPPSSNQAVPATATGFGSKAAFRGPSSYNEQDSFPSSFNSARRSGWTMVSGGGYGTDSMDTVYSADVEDRMDVITQHWDIIMRTLTHLQSVVATTLYTLLKQVDMASPDPYPNSTSSHLARTPSISSRRGDDFKPPKTNAKPVALLPNVLVDDRGVQAEADLARARIVSGLRATRITTGQNRWGIWREEARLVAKWVGQREQGFFFFNLLTGFLSTHTDWLQALGPPPYRKRHFLQQKARAEEDMALSARTIVVSQDKMAARRVLFLLSAFLPANQQLPNTRTQRPSTSASYGAFSQSPPSYVVPMLKEESLRRKINRRQGPRRASHSRNVSIQTQRSSGVPTQLAHLSLEGRHQRRASDAASIRTTDLPLQVHDPATRKSSAATATITSEATIPHFTSVHRESLTLDRPSSSSSFATDDLKRTLQRGDSSGQYSATSSDSRQSSRWGSVISGLWNGRRRESSNTSAPNRGSNWSREGYPTSPTKMQSYRDDKLAEMVREVNDPVSPRQSSRSTVLSSHSEANDPETPRQLPGEARSSREQMTEALIRTPDPAGAFASPVKTSINVDDGVIDVDVPFPDYIASFETAVSSPSSSGYLSTPGFGSGLEGFEQYCRVNVDGDVPLNAAGWLPCYHPDFGLQAIPAQSDLVEQVKASLKAEPSPVVGWHPESGDQVRWIDVASAIIADVNTFSILRIRYRRLVKPKAMVDRALWTATMNAYTSSALTPSVAPYETLIADEFIEEPIISLDETLIEAVEKVIGRSGDGSIESSACSSRSTSKRRERSGSESSQRAEEPEAPAPLSGPQEVPRAECKTVVLSALEDVVKQVLEAREREADGGRKGGREKESVLRVAVRDWLENVELSE